MDFSIDSLLLILCQISIIQSATVPLANSNPVSLPNPESVFITLSLKNDKPEKISITKPKKGLDKFGIDNTRKGICGSEIFQRPLVNEDPEKASIIDGNLQISANKSKNNITSILPVNECCTRMPVESTISPFIENILTNNNIKQLHNCNRKIEECVPSLSSPMLKDSKKQDMIRPHKSFPNWEATQKSVNDAYKLNTDVINLISNQSKITNITNISNIMKQHTKVSAKDLCVNSVSKIPVITDFKTEVHNLMEEVPHKDKSELALIKPKNDISAVKFNNARIFVPQKNNMVQEVQQYNNLSTGSENDMPIESKNTLEHKTHNFDIQIFSSEFPLTETEKYIRQIELENILKNQKSNRIHNLLATERPNEGKTLNQCGNKKILLEKSDLMQQLSNRAVDDEIKLPLNPSSTTVLSVDLNTHSNLLEPIAMIAHSPKDFFPTVNTFLNFEKNNDDNDEKNYVPNNLQIKPQFSPIENIDINKISVTPIIDYGVLGDALQANEMMTMADLPFLIKQSEIPLRNDYASIMPVKKHIDSMSIEPKISSCIDNISNNNNNKKLLNYFGSSKLEECPCSLSPAMLIDSKKQEPVMPHKAFPNWEATQKFVNDAYKINTEVINSITNESKIKQFKKASVNSAKDTCLKKFPNIPLITDTNTKETAIPIALIQETSSTINKLEGYFPPNINNNQITVPKQCDGTTNQFENTRAHIPVTNIVSIPNNVIQGKVDDTVANVLQLQAPNCLPNNQYRFITPEFIDQQKSNVELHPESHILPIVTDSFNLPAYANLCVPSTKIEASYPISSDSSSSPVLNKEDCIFVTPELPKCLYSIASGNIEPNAMYNSLSKAPPSAVIPSEIKTQQRELDYSLPTRNIPILQPSNCKSSMGPVHITEPLSMYDTNIPCSSVTLSESKIRYRELDPSLPLTNSVPTYQSSNCMKSMKPGNINIEPLEISKSLFKGSWSSVSPSEIRTQQKGLDYSLPLANNIPVTVSNLIEPLIYNGPITTQSNYVFKSTNDPYVDYLSSSLDKLVPALTSNIVSALLSNSLNEQSNAVCCPLEISENQSTEYPPIIKKSLNYLTPHIISPTNLPSCLETDSINIGPKKSVDLINLPEMKPCDSIPIIYPENPSFYYPPCKLVDSANPTKSWVMLFDSELADEISSPNKYLNSFVTSLNKPCITVQEDYTKKPNLSTISGKSNNFVTPLSPVSYSTAYSGIPISPNIPSLDLLIPSVGSFIDVEDIDSNIKFKTEEDITESIIPYIASITINVMPPKDPQNHLIIVI